MQRTARCLVGIAGLWGLRSVLRRLSRRSGVTDAELHSPLPGDGLLDDPMVEWTRATTIAAPPEQVWPWLVQMGYGRGGWYTNERFDRIVWRIDNPSVDEIVAHHQHLSVGDIVPDGPDHAAYFRVAELVPREAIVYRSIRHPFRGHPVDPTDTAALERLEVELRTGGDYLDFSWAWALTPVGSAGTRLTVRTRADYRPRWLRGAEIPLGLVDLFHVSAMFRGIRSRVEAQDS